jgi:hypothetical protein
MTWIYTIKQGDHLSSIAKAFSFSDYHKIWNDPNNASLKRLRQNPHVLYPGDQIFIPDKEIQSFSKSTDEKHRFVLKAKPLQIELRFERAYLWAISSALCDLSVAASSAGLVSDRDGSIRKTIAKDASQARAVIHEPATGGPASVARGNAQRDTVVPIRIGYLDPPDELSGQVQRLSNLGYYRGSFESPDPDDFDSAVQEFQCDSGMVVDGICGPKTQAKLEQIHGC